MVSGMTIRNQLKTLMNYYKNLFNFRGKNVFILGGSGLIGQEVSKAILDLEGRVINLDIKNNSKKEDKNYKYQYLNVENVNKLSKKIFSIIKKHGEPNVFINCSYPKTKDWSKNNFKNISLESFEKNIKIQLNSSCWILRLFAESMVKKKIKGSIVQLNSIYGLVGQDMNIYKNTNLSESMSYSIIKGGQLNLVRQMASYYGKYNIRINSICAGGVENKQNKKFIKNYSKKALLKRLAKSSEIASAALFLSSEAASYITGSNLVVDGGWTSI